MIRFGPDCSGPCEECSTHYTGGCLAGHGDDDFHQITVEDARSILKSIYTKEYKKEALLKKFPELVKEG